MIAQLLAANRKLRQARPADQLSGHCGFFRQGELLEISVPSFGCPHDAQGRCIMCNYGSAVPALSQAQVEAEFDTLLAKHGVGIRKLLLSTNGSFLDDQCVPLSVQQALLHKAQNSCTELVLIETHVDTITSEKLSMLQTILSGKTILLELGMESSNPQIQQSCYLKSVPLEAVEEALRQGVAYSFLFQLNVILGSPFLAPREQMADAEDTLRWVLGHGALAALFPMNIKPFTLLKLTYEKGFYSPISHWMVPLLLSRFSKEELARIDLAWYGNREIKYSSPDLTTVFPTDCPHCHCLLRQFDDAYAVRTDGEVRHGLVKSVLDAGTHSCQCLMKAKATLSRSPSVHAFSATHSELLSVLRQENLI